MREELWWDSLDLVAADCCCAQKVERPHSEEEEEGRGKSKQSRDSMKGRDAISGGMLFRSFSVTVWEELGWSGKRGCILWDKTTEMGLDKLESSWSWVMREISGGMTLMELRETVVVCMCFVYTLNGEAVELQQTHQMVEVGTADEAHGDFREAVVVHYGEERRGWWKWRSFGQQRLENNKQKIRWSSGSSAIQSGTSEMKLPLTVW